MVDIVDIVDIDIVDIVDTVEIVDIFDTFNIVDINEAIWNKARLSLKQSQKRELINNPLSIMALRDASASKKGWFIIDVFGHLAVWRTPIPHSSHS